MGPLSIPTRCATCTAGLDDVEQWKSSYQYGSLVEFLLIFHDAHFDSVLSSDSCQSVCYCVMQHTFYRDAALQLGRCTPAPWLVM